MLPAIVTIAVAAAWYAKLNPTVWQSIVLPGKLSAAHSFLEADCSACHLPFRGADRAKCIACHAANEALLQRQPTAFHANVPSCVGCHIEHQGINANLRVMDHETLAKIGSALGPVNTTPSASISTPLLPPVRPIVSEREARLDCANCHSTKDRHFGMFGQSCALCHSTANWTIPSFQHPSPRSVECAQCHKAPPSHYMEHFEMVSKRVARQQNAEVGQCYICHQTTSWNDIKGVGFYKHH